MNIEKLILKLIGHECEVREVLLPTTEPFSTTRPVFVRTVDTSRELAPMIQRLYPGESLQGKLHFESGEYKLATFDSMEAFILSRHIGYKAYRWLVTKGESDWHRCSHYAVDFAGQFHHDQDWTGAAVGTIHFWPGEGSNHVVGFMFGCKSEDDPALELRFWEVPDETYRNPATVIGGKNVLHGFRAP